MLRRLPEPEHPDLLVGTSSGDDAAVWRVDEHRALVATVDVFTPIVDDARTWGGIAAANSASDVYAMGGRPLFALNIAGWPRDTLPLDLLAEVLEGASEVAERGRWLVVGGHTIDAPEPFFGQSVTGEVNPDQIIANDAAKAGQVIILTKAIGTGLVATAAKLSDVGDVAANGRLHTLYAEAIASMLRLNDEAASVAIRYGVRAGTDITGFGLLGHLHRLALSSAVSIRLYTQQIPIFTGLFDLVDQGFVPGGTGRNLEDIFAYLTGPVLSDGRWLNVLGDPQTSGGLALCVARDQADDALAELQGLGLPAKIIAEIEPAQLQTTLTIE